MRLDAPRARKDVNVLRMRKDLCEWPPRTKHHARIQVSEVQARGGQEHGGLEKKRKQKWFQIVNLKYFVPWNQKFELAMNGSLS